MNNPSANASPMAITISNIVTAATFSKKLDLKISENEISPHLLYNYFMKSS